MSGRKIGRTGNTIDPELAEAQTKITSMEQANTALEKTVEDRDLTIKDLEQKLTAAEKLSTASQAESQQRVGAMEKELETLRQQHAMLEAQVQEKDSKCTTMETQLKSAMDGTGRMQTELQTAQRESARRIEEAKVLNIQLSEALRDLSLTKEELLKERANKDRLEDGKSKAERALEAMMAEMQEQQNKGTASTQLWIAATMTACGTACVISLLLMKYYNTH